MKQIAIVGGGAAGLVTAIIASKNKNNFITIYERNKECGKKLLVTGNGRCNYFNDDQSINNYHSYTNNLLKNLFTEQNILSVKNFFNELGIVPKIKDGYYYPYSNQAITIKNVLINELNKSNIIVKYETKIEKIKKEVDRFILVSNKQEYYADKVVLACGSMASPKTGSDGIGYKLAESLGHNINDILPSLVQLIAHESYLKEWQGIRTDVKLKLEEDGNIIAKDEGEIQLTDYGISGICVFNLSNYVSKGLYLNKKEIMHINFLPFMKNDVYDKLNELNSHDKTVGNLLEGILNYKLVNIILKKSKIDGSIKYSSISQDKKDILINNLVDFKINIIATKDFNNAQVCSGGVSLDEINLTNMESNIVNDCYLVGEIIDVNGNCGGYNLTNAWLTGILAGEDLANDKN